MLCHAGTKASVARPQRIHFNATFEEKAEGQGAQPEEQSQQQAQMLTASSRLEALPRVSEEGEEAPETPLTISSGKADMAHDDARSGVSKEIPPLPQEAAQSVDVDFDNFTASQAFTEIEAMPAKVVVEFEEYQSPTALVPHRGSVSICIIQSCFSCPRPTRFSDQLICAKITFCAFSESLWYIAPIDSCKYSRRKPIKRFLLAYSPLWSLSEGSFLQHGIQLPEGSCAITSATNCLYLAEGRHNLRLLDRLCCSRSMTSLQVANHSKADQIDGSSETTIVNAIK